MARDFKPGEVVALLTAFAELRLLPPSAVLASLLGEHRGAEQQLSAYSPRNLATLAYALARLTQLHAAAWAQRQQRARQQHHQHPAAPQAEGGQAQPPPLQPPALPPPPPGAPALRPPPPLAGAPRELREELLHCSFHRLGAMGGRDLSTLVWALVELALEPPPAWLYSCVAACDAQLGAMSAADLAMLVRALQRRNADAQLARVDEFLARALERLGQLEAADGEYTAGRLNALLAMASPGDDGAEPAPMAGGEQQQHPHHHHQQLHTEGIANGGAAAPTRAPRGAAAPRGRPRRQQKPGSGGRSGGKAAAANGVSIIGVAAEISLALEDAAPAPEAPSHSSNGAQPGNGAMAAAGTGGVDSNVGSVAMAAEPPATAAVMAAALYRPSGSLASETEQCLHLPPAGTAAVRTTPT